jgi:Uri superfamily endonuclease
MKGSYILSIRLRYDREIKIGKLGEILFKRGLYLYVGSALNNLEKRIQRHLRNNKKIHWHIDFLLRKSKIEKIYYYETNFDKECEIAENIKKISISIPGFGCSDCKCKSHLFFSVGNDLLEIIDQFNLKEYFFDKKS